jgi:hypothetical protein
MNQHKGTVLVHVLEVREHRTKRAKTSSSKEAPL